MWAGELRRGEGERALKATVLVTYSQPGAGGAGEKRGVGVCVCVCGGGHQEGLRKKGAGLPGRFRSLG